MLIQRLLIISLVALSFSCQKEEISHPSAIFDPDQATTRIPSGTCYLKGLAIVQSRSGEATAFSIGPNLWLTNSHAMEQCDEDRCLFPVTVNGKLAELVKRRETLDYAILKVEGDNQYVWPLAGTSDQHEGIIVRRLIENENDPYWISSGSMTYAFGMNRGMPVLTYKINTLPGNSGSPLINERSEIVGLHSGVTDDGLVNFALPIHSIVESMSAEPMKELENLLQLLETDAKPSAKKDILRVLYAAKDNCSNLKSLSQLIEQSKYQNELDKYFSLSKRFDRQELVYACLRLTEKE